MNPALWRKATRVQLYEIAFNDSGAPLKYRLDALNEIRRRQNKPKLNGKPIEHQYAKRW